MSSCLKAKWRFFSRSVLIARTLHWALWNSHWKPADDYEHLRTMTLKMLVKMSIKHDRLRLLKIQSNFFSLPLNGKKNGRTSLINGSKAKAFREFTSFCFHSEFLCYEFVTWLKNGLPVFSFLWPSVEGTM